jgi:hypothetical protein
MSWVPSTDPNVVVSLGSLQIRADDSQQNAYQIAFVKESEGTTLVNSGLWDPWGPWDDYISFFGDVYKKDATLAGENGGNFLKNYNFRILCVPKWNNVWGWG